MPIRRECWKNSKGRSIVKGGTIKYRSKLPFIIIKKTEISTLKLPAGRQGDRVRNKPVVGERSPFGEWDKTG